MYYMWNIYYTYVHICKLNSRQNMILGTNTMRMGRRRCLLSILNLPSICALHCEWWYQLILKYTLLWLSRLHSLSFCIKIWWIHHTFLFYSISLVFLLFLPILLSFLKKYTTYNVRPDYLLAAHWFWPVKKLWSLPIKKTSKLYLLQCILTFIWTWLLFFFFSPRGLILFRPRWVTDFLLQ